MRQIRCSHRWLCESGSADTCRAPRTRGRRHSRAAPGSGRCPPDPSPTPATADSPRHGSGR